MARAADIEVLRGDGMEHDRSTSVVERSYTLRRFARLGCDACHGGLVTASAICGGGLGHARQFALGITYALCGLPSSVFEDGNSVVMSVTLAPR